MNTTLPQIRVEFSEAEAQALVDLAFGTEHDEDALKSAVSKLSEAVDNQ